MNCGTQPNNTGLKRGLSRSLLAVILGSITGSAVAANVPADAVLADKQEIVRHIKDEPASLDPIKAVGLPEAQVSREGYLIRTLKDGRSPAWRCAGKPMTTEPFYLRCALVEWRSGDRTGFCLQLAASG